MGIGFGLQPRSFQILLRSLRFDDDEACIRIKDRTMMHDEIRFVLAPLLPGLKVDRGLRCDLAVGIAERGQQRQQQALLDIGLALHREATQAIPKFVGDRLGCH